MDAFANTDLKELITAKAKTAVSIYLPTHPSSEAGQQDPIVLKNLLTEAETALGQRGMSVDQINHLLKPAYAALNDPNFWRNRAQGLAMFVADGSLRCWKLPVAFSPLAWVGPTCYVKPLYALVDEGGRYYVLAASQNLVRVFTGTRYELTELSLPAIPRRLADVSDREAPEGSRQVHSGAAASAGKAGSVHHGHGSAEDHLKKEELRQYCRMIDRGLHGVLANEQAPLVFVGVEYLFPIYREVNSYVHLLDSPIATNPDRLSNSELRSLCAEHLDAYWHRHEREDRARFNRAIGSELVSSNIESIVTASADGEVESLFIPSDSQLWGRYDASTRRVAFRDRPSPGVDDLFELAAANVFANGGRVHVMPAKDIPGATNVDAVFRYAVVKPEPAKAGT